MHKNKHKPIEIEEKAGGSYSRFKIRDMFDADPQKMLQIMNELKLDPSNEIHTAAAYAYVSREHLYNRSKKTTLKKYGKKLDQVTDQALKLAETIRDIEPSGYMSLIENSFRRQCNIKVTGLSITDCLLQSIAANAQFVKITEIEPIPSGYYTPFLFEFVNTLLVDTNFLAREFDRYLALKKTEEITKNGIKEFFITAWKRKYLKEVRKTSKLIIKAKLSGIEEESVDKAIYRHLNRIVEDRIGDEINLLAHNYIYNQQD